MTDLKRAAENVQRFSELFRSVTELADAAKSIGSLEQATREAMIAKERAISERDKAEAVQAELELRVSKTQASIDKVNDGARATIATAQQEAQRLIREGEDKAAEALKGVIGRNAQLEKQLADGRVLLGEVNRQIKAKQDELAALEKKLEQVRAKVEAIMRG